MRKYAILKKSYSYNACLCRNAIDAFAETRKEPAKTSYSFKALYMMLKVLVFFGANPCAEIHMVPYSKCYSNKNHCFSMILDFLHND